MCHPAPLPRLENLPVPGDPLTLGAGRAGLVLFPPSPSLSRCSVSWQQKWRFPVGSATTRSEHVSAQTIVSNGRPGNGSAICVSSNSLSLHSITSSSLLSFSPQTTLFLSITYSRNTSWRWPAPTTRLHGARSSDFWCRVWTLLYLIFPLCVIIHHNHLLNYRKSHGREGWFHIVFSNDIPWFAADNQAVSGLKANRQLLFQRLLLLLLLLLLLSRISRVRLCATP